MQAQVTAEREKRASILSSEAVRQSAINIAEGKKQSTILASEATRAENINKAEGEARAILLKSSATSQGLRMVAHAIQSPGGEQAVSMDVAEKYVEAFGKLAKEGNAVVVPAALGDIGGMIAQVCMSNITHANPRHCQSTTRSTNLEWADDPPPPLCHQTRMDHMTGRHPLYNPYKSPPLPTQTSKVRFPREPAACELPTSRCRMKLFLIS